MMNIIKNVITLYKNIKNDTPTNEKSFIGVSEEYLMNYCQAHNIRYRISARDNFIAVQTRDYDPNRLNAYLKNGYVTKVNYG